MFIWLGTRTAVRKLGPATGKCHACGSEGRLVNMQVVEQPTLYSFAIGYGIPLAEFLACDACGVQFRSRPLAGHQIGDVAIGSENWACPKCSASNSGAVYKCGACGYSLV
jgi:hypothetical protein